MVALTLTMLLSGGLSLSHAAGVLPMDVSTLAEFAGQVVTGTVHSAVPQWAENPRRIETTVTLQDIETLKGMPSAESGAFSFVVPGGTIDGTRMQIGGAPTFHVGERWLFFLLPTYKIFPVVGIHRGCFRVQQASDGIERMYDASHKPILGLDPNNRIIIAATASAPNQRLVGEAGVRLHTADASLRGERAIRYEAFRRLLRPILDQSRDYQLTHPAGRRAVHHWTATTLKSASGGKNVTELAIKRRSVLRSFDTPKRAAPRGRAPRTH